jgi:SAM-dependent methyltransferase
MKIISIDCLVCGSKSHKAIYKNLVDVEDGVPGAYTISRCKNCGFVFLSVRPTIKSLAQCYPHDYHARVENWSGKISRFLYTLKYYFEYRRLNEIVGHVPQSMLDIGCGSGGLLLELRRRWGRSCHLAGLDQAASTTTDLPKAGVDLYVCDIGKFHSSKKYEIVTMNEVVEHVYNPVKTLKTVRILLKKGGLLIGEVPHFKSPWLKVFPRHWGGFQIPRHMTFFDDATITKVLQTAGFRVIATGNRYSPGDLGVSLCNWIVNNLQPDSRPRRSPIYLPLMILTAPISLFMHILFHVPCNLEFVAVKTDD